MAQHVSKLCSVCLLMLLVKGTFAQQPEKNIDAIIESLIENRANDDEQFIQPEEWIDRLHHLSENPVSVNTATEEELKSIGLLNDFQVHSLIKYRKENGYFESIFELQLVYGFNINLIKQIIPFISLEKTRQSPGFKNAFRHTRHEFVARYQSVIEKQKGYLPANDSLPPKYFGNPSRQYYRYQLKAGNKIKAGVTLEKDPGETLFSGKIYQGLDYNSGYIQLNGKGVLKQLNLVDFHTNWGQGLVLWTGFGMGKSSFVTNTEKVSTGISKYSSSNENRLLRGVSTTLKLKNWEFAMLFSGKLLDAGIQADSVETGVTSFYESGLHNTGLSLEKKDRLKEHLAGLRLSHKREKFRLGVSVAHHQFGQQILKSEKFYKLYDFSGTEYQNIGIDYHYNLGKFIIYGEEAVSSTRGTAFLNGALIKVHPRIMMNVLHRAYSKKYFAHYSNAFSESSKIKNEQGFYIGLDLFPFQKVKLSAYADAYRFPWATFSCSVPSYGNDYFLQAEYLPNDHLMLKFLMKTESKDVDYSNETTKTDITAISKNTKYRFDFSYVLTEQVELKNRLELSCFSLEKENEQGTMFYQDVRYKPKNLPFRVYLRYSLFNTQGYASRIYTYENDVLYTFNIPALFDTGLRYYTMVKWEASKNISLWARFSRTTYRDRETVSSGDNEIQGNKKSEIKLQLRWKL